MECHLWVHSLNNILAFFHSYWAQCRVIFVREILIIHGITISITVTYNESDCVRNHRLHDCLVYRLFCEDKRKHQSSALLAFGQGIHRWPVNSPHTGPVTRKLFPFDDVIILPLRLRPPLPSHLAQRTAHLPTNCSTGNEKPGWSSQTPPGCSSWNIVRYIYI